MPRPRKNKEKISHKLLDSLNKSKGEKNEKGFYRDENGFIINDEKYILSSFSQSVVIGKLNKYNEIVYLNDKDCEWCIKNKIKYEKYL